MLVFTRSYAGEPDYCGPDLGLLERVAADIAAVQAQVRDWPRRLCSPLLESQIPQYTALPIARDRSWRG